MNKIKIFVSYCHASFGEDLGRLELFLQALEKKGAGAYEILVDFRHRGGAVGSNLKKFIRELDSCNVILLILTPEYKNRADRRQESGVYDEFSRILDRLAAAEEAKSYERDLLVLPLVFSGEFNDACPKQVKHLVNRDLSSFNLIPRDGKPRARRAQMILLRAAIEEISARINAISVTGPPTYVKAQHDQFEAFLFQDSKSRWDQKESRIYLDTVFVKTETFLKARDRRICFIIGRKGSGKSTITHVLPILSETPPQKVLRIEFDNVPFSVCFNLLRSQASMSSDVENVFGELHSYQMLWDVFLHLILAYECKDLILKSSALGRLLGFAFKIPWGVADEHVMSVKARLLFVFAFEKLAKFVDAVVVERAGKEGILAAMIGNFNPFAFREFVFGRSGLMQLETLVNILSDSKGRVLVTADGFDVMTGSFRRSVREAVGEAARFERELLLALFQVVLDRGPAKTPGGTFYDILDFCITVPQDRFLEIRSLDRDRYRYRHKFATIAWSGIELSALVRKRLAVLREVPDPQGKSLEERLEDILKTGYSELPREIAFQFGSAHYRMPLFIYLLRHTFWRPRDILFFFASILAAAKQFKKKKTQIPGDFVRQVVAGATRTVVEDEVIAEFNGVFGNLREVLTVFRHKKQVLEWDELGACLRGVRFEIGDLDRHLDSLENKVELLFEMGILGVLLDEESSRRFSAFRHAFIFNEGPLLSEKIGKDAYSHYSYIVHPVFCEFLHLETSSNLELILPLDWPYLHSNEVLRGIRPPGMA